MSLVVDAAAPAASSFSDVPATQPSPPGEVPSSRGVDRSVHIASDKRTGAFGSSPRGTATEPASHGSGAVVAPSISSGAGAGAGAGSDSRGAVDGAADGATAPRGTRGGRGSVNGSEDAVEGKDEDNDSEQPQSGRRLSITDSLEHMSVSHQNQRLPGHHAVFVSDMSGFTRITRKMGITHFGASLLWSLTAAAGSRATPRRVMGVDRADTRLAHVFTASLILKMRSIVWPLLTAFGAESIQVRARSRVWVVCVAGTHP